MSIKYAYARFCEERFPLPTQKDIDHLEERLCTALPDAMREFLLEFNGGYFNEPLIIPPYDDDPVTYLNSLYGIKATLSCAEIATDLWVVSDYVEGERVEILPIGTTTMGWLILLDLGKEQFGEIYLRSFDETFWLAEGIEEFFELLSPRADDPVE